MKRLKRRFFRLPAKRFLIWSMFAAVLVLGMYQWTDSYWAYRKWWKYLTDGQFYTPLTVYNSLILAGNSNGSVYAINRTTGAKAWNRKFDHAIHSEIITHNGRAVFTTEGGELITLRIKDGSLAWKFPSPSLYRFTGPPVVRNNRLYISDASGIMYCLNAATGNLLWSYPAPEQAASDAQSLTDHPNQTQSRLSVQGNRIFFAGITGILTALDAATGKPIWTFSSSSPFTTAPVLLGDRIYIGNVFGENFAISHRDGSVEWKHSGDAAVSCILPVFPAQEWHHLGTNPAISAILSVLRRIYPWRTDTVLTYQNGTVTMLDKTQRTVWSRETGAGIGSCPYTWFSNLYLMHANQLEAVDIRTGNTRWTNQTAGTYHTSTLHGWKPVVIRRNPLRIDINVPLLVTGDSEGNLSATDGKSGNMFWSSRCYGYIFQPPKTVHNSLYYACTDGGIYQISASSGNRRPFLNTLTVSKQKQRVGSYDIVEFTIHHPDWAYTNPYEEVEVRMILKNALRDQVIVNGFYYDKDTWKVRINPPEVGEWRWNLQFITPASTLTKSGTFTSDTDTKTAFFRIDKRFPDKITLDGKTIFSGVGIGDAVIDWNSNGYPLDDWSIGDMNTDSAAIAASDSARFPTVGMETYAQTYGPANGGFNLFRWSINNASFNLWNQFTFQSKYLTREGMYGDKLVTTLVNNGFHIWLTMFSFGIPNDAMASPGEREALLRFVRYVVARYGSYVSMWEIANESYASDETIGIVANEIQNADFEKRPVGTSWDHPLHTELDVITPHAYLTEPVHQSDDWIVKQIKGYEKFGKPILFGELGNGFTNWDKDSALRMRVKSWVSFFRHAILVYWNTSFNKNYHNEVINNGNQYIGSQERQYIRNLTRFTTGIGLDATGLLLPTDNKGVRSYGLQSSNEILGYFYHFADPYAAASISVPLYLPHPSVITWYNPAEGTIISESRYPTGNVLLHPPRFTADIALKAVFQR